MDNKKVYLLHYPKGQTQIFLSQGIIKKELNNKYFKAYYGSEEGSSGCPIIDYEKDLVIGIHRGKCKKKNK